MESQIIYLLVADAILLLHVLFIAFVILGLILILLGGALSWSWVRNPRFRIGHLAVVAYVVLQSYFGAICPLTTWEVALRARAGDSVYSGSFISHWLETLLYYEAPPWIFMTCYTAFAALVVASWYWVRPRQLGKRWQNVY
jgi:hypothetical protein